MALYNHFRSRRNPTNKSRHPLNYVHIAVGLATVAVGWASVYTGWSTQWPKPDDSGTGPIGKGYQVAYWLIGAVSLLLVMLMKAGIERSLRTYHSARVVGSVGLWYGLLC